MRYRIRHTTKYGYEEPVAVCHNLVRLTPRVTERQSVVATRLVVSPEPTDRVDRRDPFGNAVHYLAVEEAHNGLALSAVSEVTVRDGDPTPERSDPWEDVRDTVRLNDNPRRRDALRFVYPSPLAPVDAKLAAYAAESFRPGRPIVESAVDFTSRMHADFRYDPGVTTVTTPVMDAFAARHGVCQDFAHIGIACLRSLGLPARYVSGYLRTIPPPGKPRLVGADASHAWMSVYCGRAGWVDLDPTNDCVPRTDHVTVAFGRDYADVCPIQGVFVGGGNQTLTVEVDVEPLADPPRRRVR